MRRLRLLFRTSMLRRITPTHSLTLLLELRLRACLEFSPPTPRYLKHHAGWIITVMVIDLRSRKGTSGVRLINSSAIVKPMTKTATKRKKIPLRHKSPFGWWIASYIERFEHED